METINVQVEKLDERYCGEKTGRAVYHTSSTGCNILGAVLGRGYSEAESLRDWVFRAKADGHKVVIGQLNVVKRTDRTTG